MKQSRKEEVSIDEKWIKQKELCACEGVLGT